VLFLSYLCVLSLGCSYYQSPSSRAAVVLTLGSAHVAQSDDVRVLGVQLSSDLSLDKHVNVVSAKCFFNYDNYAAFDFLLMTTLSLHSFMRSSQAESITATVS